MADTRARLLRGALYFPMPDVATIGDYYHDVFGFELEYAGGTPPEFAVYSRDRCALMLKRVTDASRIHPNEAQGGKWEVFFWVADVDASYNELRARGAVFAYDPIVQTVRRQRVRRSRSARVCAGVRRELAS